MSYTFSAKPRKIQKANEANSVLRRLRAFLDKNEPALVYWLVHTWRTQAQAITYKELREAILAGAIDQYILDEWQQDYAAFVRDHLYPAWMDAMKAATKELHKKYPDWYFDPMAEGVREWAENRAAAFVTEVTATQIEGLRALVFRAAVLENMTVDQLARAIRPMVGLTHPQAIANMRYYEKLIENGVSEQKAQDLAARYAARQHRYRGYNIARTELAFSYNQGAHFGIKQAQEQGYMGETVKIWSTADDERVCEICGALEGQRVGMDEDFSFQTRLNDPGIRLTPPAHPSCRCAVMYKEISPPIRAATITTTQTPQKEGK